MTYSQPSTWKRPDPAAEAEQLMYLRVLVMGRDLFGEIQGFSNIDDVTEGVFVKFEHPYDQDAEAERVDFDKLRIPPAPPPLSLDAKNEVIMEVDTIENQQDKDRLMLMLVDFKSELTSLIKTHSVDNTCGVPDFLLSEMLIDCLLTHTVLLAQVRKYHALT